MMRSAISPRLAIRIFLIGPDGKQRLPVLHRLTVHHQLALDGAGDLSLDLVHELHGLDDAEDLTGLDVLADPYKRRRAGPGAFIESADDWGTDQNEVRIGAGFLGFARSGQVGLPYDQ